MRKSGILMHITSLPGPYGIGSMGQCAYDFIDFLQEAGQSCWQILPLNPTGYGNSPYQSFSSFAGNHYLIDLDALVSQGLLRQEELDCVTWSEDGQRVDFGIQYTQRTRLLQLAFQRFTPDAGYRRFLAQNRQWLEDYALFMALKEAFGGREWQNWSVSLMLRIPGVVQDFRERYSQKVEFQYFLQYLFFCQWDALHDYARSKGIRIIGDVPIYVPLDSAEVWANPGLFCLNSSCRPIQVAGCPPDSFSADGQLWGNPLYNWQRMRETGYEWWIRRLRAAARMYDVVRLDHFRGFESYWAIPAGRSAADGHWEKGPGMELFDAIRSALPELPMIAEDLGYVTEEVRQLQLRSGYPGMKVLQFAFDSREEGNYSPHLYPTHSVCYSGTHDNLTLRQWLEEALPQDVAQAKAYLGLNSEEGFLWGMLRGAMSSVSDLCVIQMQDYLELGGEARMNHPGTLSPHNWTWRAKPGFASRDLAQRIRQLTQRYGRS